MNEAGSKYGPSTLRDRFKGKSSVAATRERHFDTGAPKGFMGAPIAPYKGSVGAVQDAARIGQKGLMKPGRANATGGQTSLPVGQGDAPGLSIPGGHGPKVKGGAKGGGNPRFGAKTGGKDMSPKTGSGKNLAAKKGMTKVRIKK